MGLAQRFAWELADSFVWEPLRETQLIMLLTMKNFIEFFGIRKDKLDLIQPRIELFTVYHYHKL